MSNGPYFTYIVASRSRTLYIGITGNLRHRAFEHKLKIRSGFTARYNCNRLVWFERFEEVTAAIDREKELKGWIRTKKVVLIEKDNPDLGGSQCGVVSALGVGEAATSV